MESKEASIISVIVPVYKIKEEYLKKCIESIQKQTYEQIQIILVDDGSPDDCGKICDEYKKQDERIVVIHKENAGVSSARNEGLKHAIGQYICFVDADDWIDIEFCEKMISEMKRKDVDIIFASNSREYLEKTVRISPYHSKNILLSSENQFNMFDMKLIGTVWAKIYKRELINNIRFDEELTNAEDIEFNFRVITQKTKCAFIEDYGYHYRYLEESAVRNFKENMVSNYNKTLTRINKNLNDVEKNKKEAYLAFVATVYIALCTNYIFNPKNNIPYKDKKKQLIKLSNDEIYKEAIKGLDMSLLPLTRRSIIWAAKYKIYFLIYLIVKIKKIQDYIFNGRKRKNDRTN